MRRIFNPQSGLEFHPADEKSRAQLEAMDRILKENEQVLKMVAKDLSAGTNSKTGRPGMSADQVLRVAIVKQLYGLSYQLLFQRLDDSNQLRKFCQYEWQVIPKTSALQDNIKRLTPETLEAVNRAIVESARKKKVELGKKVRFDTTTVESDIHHPTDSTLIQDCVRVICRILRQAREAFPEAGITFHDRQRVVKKRVLAIFNSRKAEVRKSLYTDLLRYASEVLAYGLEGKKRLLAVSGPAEEEAFAELMAEELGRVTVLLEKIIDQTKRRVLHGESVPAKEKVVSIFEEHTDILEKGGRDTVFGHKVCIAAGKSGIVLDCITLQGNPADSTLYPAALDRVIDLNGGRVPSSTAADGGFASKANVEYGEGKGVRSVFFNKTKVRPKGSELSGWMSKLLRKFRAGVEGIISTLKRSRGLGRCLWNGWQSFKSYVWASVVAHNLKTLGVLLVKREESVTAPIW